MSKVSKVVATNLFETALKKLKKDHKTQVLEELDKAIDDLINMRLTTQKQNHPLVNASGHRDLHLEGKRLILLYKYEYSEEDSDDLVLIISLRLQDIVNHKELKSYNRKKYKASTHEFDPKDILNSTQVDDFEKWYSSLDEEEQWIVDEIADSNEFPNYDEASKAELSWLKKEYYKED